MVSGNIEYERSHEKTNNLGVLPGQTQTRLYSHRRRQEAGNFGFRKKRNCTIRVAKKKGADQLRIYCEADLGLSFRIGKKSSFLMTRLIKLFRMKPQQSWLPTMSDVSDLRRRVIVLSV